MIASASAISASALTFLACRYISKRREAKENVYETEKLIGEYLIFHYGKPDELLPYGFGPTESLEFPTRCAMECIKHTEVSAPVKYADLDLRVTMDKETTLKSLDGASLSGYKERKVDAAP